MPPTEERFREAFDLLERHIETRYGIPVVVGDVAEPFTGDLDGAEIRVDFDQSVEDALFIIAHLFGHTVQWNLSERARVIGSEVQASPTPEALEELEAYEREACGYSLTLFHECGVRDLDPWLADFAACDFAYLRHFYATGEKRAFRSFWREGSPSLEARPIPVFRPTSWHARWKGIVV
jgi:hypothetical protein